MESEPLISFPSLSGSREVCATPNLLYVCLFSLAGFCYFTFLFVCACPQTHMPCGDQKIMQELVLLPWGSKYGTQVVKLIFYPLCSGLLICLYVGLGPEKSCAFLIFFLLCSAQESALVLIFFLKFLLPFLDISFQSFLASSESHLPFISALPSVVLHLDCWSFLDILKGGPGHYTCATVIGHSVV